MYTMSRQERRDFIVKLDIIVPCDKVSCVSSYGGFNDQVVIFIAADINISG